MQSSAATYVSLEPLARLQTYANVFGNRSNVIMVASNASFTNNPGNSLFAYGSQPRNQWLLGHRLTGKSNNFSANTLDVSHFPGGAVQRAQTVANWNMGGFKIEYCLESQTSLAQDLCSVEYSFSIMISAYKT